MHVVTQDGDKNVANKNLLIINIASYKGKPEGIVHLRIWSVYHGHN